MRYSLYDKTDMSYKTLRFFYADVSEMSDGLMDIM